MDFAKWSRLLTKYLTENHEPDFGDLSKFEKKLFETKTWADVRETKIWKITIAKNAWLYRSKNFAKNQNPDLQDSKRQFETQLNFWNCLKDLTQVLANGLRYPRWGGRRNAVRNGKMLRRRKRLGIAPESPASGARFVGTLLEWKTRLHILKLLANQSV